MGPIALVVNNLYDLWVWRQPLIRAVCETGCEVLMKAIIRRTSLRAATLPSVQAER